MDFKNTNVNYIFVKHEDKELIFRRRNAWQWELESETNSGITNNYVLDNAKAEGWANAEKILEYKAA